MNEFIPDLNYIQSGHLKHVPLIYLQTKEIYKQMEHIHGDNGNSLLFTNH